jgi:hypothetical protein
VCVHYVHSTKNAQKVEHYMSQGNLVPWKWQFDGDFVLWGYKMQYRLSFAKWVKEYQQLIS